MRLFIDAFVGSKNLGDQVIFESLARRLRRLFPESHLAVATCTSRYATDLVDTTVSGHQLAMLARLIRSSNLVIYGGGGLIQDETSLLNMARHALHWRLIRSARVAMVMVGMGIGPLRRSWSRRQAAAALRYATMVAVRDKCSYELALRLGVPSAKLVLAADLAAGHEAGACRSYRERRGLCLSLRALFRRPSLLARSLSWRLRSWDTPAWRHFLAEVAQGLLSCGEVAREGVTFVSMWPGRDEVAARPLFSALADAGIPLRVVCAHTAEAAVEVMARARVTIGMRLHSLILSAKVRTPFVALTYSPKVSAFAHEVSLSDFCLSPGLLGARSLQERISRIMEHWEEVRRRLDLGMTAYESREQRNIRVVQEAWRAAHAD